MVASANAVLEPPYFHSRRQFSLFERAHLPQAPTHIPRLGGPLPSVLELLHLLSSVSRLLQLDHKVATEAPAFKYDVQPY